MSQKLPNIIFIVMDTMGAKHMSLYGYPRRTTPHLERLAEASTVYSRCFAPACWTTPSHASMFTGLYPAQHGAYEGRYLVYDNIQHLVPALSSVGYRTYGISSNYLVAPASGMCQGFEHFVDFGPGFLNLFGTHNGAAADNEFSLRLAEQNISNMKDKIRSAFDYLRETGRYRDLLQKALLSFKLRTLEFLETSLKLSPVSYSARYTEKTVKLYQEILKKHCSQNDRPFFIFMNFLEPHQFYYPPTKYRQFSKKEDKQKQRISSFYYLKDKTYVSDQMEVYRKLYDDELYYVDSVINRLWVSLKESPLFDDTIFIITSDHGEHFGEKGHFGHELSLYNDLIWVPLLIKFPGDLVKHGVDDRLVSLNDLYSTILDLADSPLPRPFTSKSLLDQEHREVVLSQIVNPDIWRGSLQSKRETHPKGVGFSPPVICAINSKGLKLIENKDSSLEAYDLLRDPEEHHDLTSDLPHDALEGMKYFMGIQKEESGFLDVPCSN